MEQIAGTYEAEGPNVTGGVAAVPDINAAPSGATNAPETPQAMADRTLKAQSKTVSVAITRRRQLRVSSESATADDTINYSGGDQVLTNVSRGLYIGAAGNLALRLKDSGADQTYSNLPAGFILPVCVAVIRQTGSTAEGIILY